MNDELRVQSRGGGVRFTVRVQPRASRNGVDGVRDGALRIRLTSPPVDGAANAALIAMLARTLDVAKRSVHIVGGVASRTKVVEIEGIDVERTREMISRSF